MEEDLTFVRSDLLAERDLRFPAQEPWASSSDLPIDDLSYIAIPECAK